MIQQNNYPMKEWHLKKMKEKVVKYITGISDDSNTSRWQRTQHKKYYGNLGYVCKSIEDDIRHGVRIEEVLAFLYEIRNDAPFAILRDKDVANERLDQIEKHFTAAISSMSYWQT